LLDYDRFASVFVMNLLSLVFLNVDSTIPKSLGNLYYPGPGVSNLLI